MSRGDLYGLYYRNIDLLLDQNNVPKKDKAHFAKLIHKGLKSALGIESMAKLTAYERWEYVQQAEILLVTEYGLDPLPDQKELKFE